MRGINKFMKNIDIYKIGVISDSLVENMYPGIRTLVLSYVYHLNKSKKYKNFLINIDKNNTVHDLLDDKYLLNRGFTHNICMGKTKTEIIKNIKKGKLHCALIKNHKNMYIPSSIKKVIKFDAVFLSDPSVYNLNFCNFNCKTYCISHDNIDTFDYFQNPLNGRKLRIQPELRKLGLNFGNSKDGIICTSKESRRHLEILDFGKNCRLKTMPIVMPPGYENINLTKDVRKACILAAPFSIRKGCTVIPKLLNNSSYEQIIIFGIPPLSGLPLVFKFFDEIKINNVEWWPYITYEKQVELYLRSKTLLFPSQIEGLGIPVLEAMACGCSTLIFDIPPINELVNPEDILPDNLEGACLKVAEHSKKSIDHEKYQQRVYNFLQAQGNFETEFSKLLN